MTEEYKYSEPDPDLEMNFDDFREVLDEANDADNYIYASMMFFSSEDVAPVRLRMTYNEPGSDKFLDVNHAYSYREMAMFYDPKEVLLETFSRMKQSLLMGVADKATKH